MRWVRQKRSVRGSLVDSATLLLAILVGGIAALILHLPWWGAGLIGGAFYLLLLGVTWLISRERSKSAPRE